MDFKNMTIAQRIKFLRKDTLKLTQTDFGKRLNVKTSTVAGWENETRSVNERTLKDICREWKVSLMWLEKGLADIFTNLPETLLDELVDEYNLSDTDKKIVKLFLELNKNERDAFTSTLRKMLID